MERDDKVRLISKTIDGAVTLGRTIVWGATIVFIAHYIHLVGVAFAGTTTEANLALSIIANVQADRWVAYILAGGGVGYGLHQRRLRQRNINRLTQHTSQLEQRIYPGRTSSGLTPEGNTAAGDR